MAWGAAATIGSSILGGLFGAFGAKSQNKANKQAAATQMAFQKEASQNQYAWAMDDMRRAGLNPILAYQKGGSGNLSGASYSAANVGESAAKGGAASAGTALQLSRLNADIQNINAQENVSREQARNLKRTNDQLDDYYSGPAGKLIFRQELSDEKAGKAGPTGTFMGWLKRMQRDDSTNPRSLNDYNDRNRRSGTGGPMGKGWFTDRYRK